MKEEIIWKLVYWDMKMVKDGWFGKPIFKVNLKYGTYREGKTPEAKFESKDFKTLKDAFNFLEEAIEIAKNVKL